MIDDISSNRASIYGDAEEFFSSLKRSTKSYDNINNVHLLANRFGIQIPPTEQEDDDDVFGMKNKSKRSSIKKSGRHSQLVNK